ncbi:hypothetical protein IMCC3317_31790 [Kordia antarctica]|uniref:Uncharacterized protein n=1 Tax=Kordia antarctica TaxID=1218801 RepID=A0A7L4ZNM3_9FLAO|nr:hypothetical protein [Kordia antarctica]QHI37796.1 hypothetical protein IMCC3317_31790 [Kordia antarctica]
MKKIIIPIVLLIVFAALFVNMKASKDDSFTFNTPAYQSKKDFQDLEKRAAFEDAWDKYVNRYTVTSANYNLSGGYDFTVPGKTYVNPKDKDNFFDGAAQIPVRWEAFPGRVFHYLEQKFNAKYKSEGLNHMYEMVDIGPEAYQAKYKDSIVFIPKNPCNPNPKEVKLFDPLGPRGWLDEYCEMGIMKNASEKLVRLHFTCENPEYYWTMWKIDPEKVLEIYRTTLKNENIQLEDLYLRDENNAIVYDRTTGRATYNPINKWNSGTKMTATSGGAMHLTSPPNELSAEIVLAGGGAVLRSYNEQENASANTLVCCSKYGRAYRHSDPHIGQNVYQAVQQGLEVTLLNPVGLYLQEPSYQYFELPANAPEGAKIEDCFRFVRGVKSAPDYPNNMILHMIMEVPDSWDSSITLNDFKVLGKKIEYGSQVMETIKVQLAAAGKPATTSSKARELDCTADNGIVGVSYFVDANILKASISKKNQLNIKANVTSNITQVAQGSTVTNLAVVIDNVIDAHGRNVKPEDFNVEISFPETNIKVTSTYVGTDAAYATLTEGNEYTFNISVEVPANVPVGQYSMLVTNNNFGLAVPHLIEVVAAGTLPEKKSI